MFGLCICLFTTSLPGTCRSQKMALDPLELGSQMVVRHHVGTGIRTLVLEEQPVFLTTEPFVQPLLWLWPSDQWHVSSQRDLTASLNQHPITVGSFWFNSLPSGPFYDYYLFLTTECRFYWMNNSSYREQNSLNTYICWKLEEFKDVLFSSS